MGQPRLRIYYGPTEMASNSVDASVDRHDTVTVSVGDVFPLLLDALETERTWLRDFEDDEITISSDLYDVMQAYQHFRRPSA